MREQKTFALIGFPLKNSFSKNYFSNKFEKLGLPYQYLNHPLSDLSSIKTWVQTEKNLGGFNVTIPHKVSILSQLDELDEGAKSIGAVNCVKIILDDLGNFKMVGYNTDAIGFKQSFEPFVNAIIQQNPKALIIGKGGAAMAVSFVLNQLKITHQFAVRNPSKNDLRLGEINEVQLASFSILINCTPIGMHPNEQDLIPLPYAAINKNHYCYDLIYLPEESSFLREAKAQGAKTMNGLEMLHLQAEAAFQIWEMI